MTYHERKAKAAAKAAAASREARIVGGFTDTLRAYGAARIYKYHFDHDSETGHWVITCYEQGGDAKDGRRYLFAFFAAVDTSAFNAAGDLAMRADAVQLRETAVYHSTPATFDLLRILCTFRGRSAIGLCVAALETQTQNEQ